MFVDCNKHPAQADSRRAGFSWLKTGQFKCFKVSLIP